MTDSAFTNIIQLIRFELFKLVSKSVQRRSAKICMRIKKLKTIIYIDAFGTDTFLLRFIVT